MKRMGSVRDGLYESVLTAALEAQIEAAADLTASIDDVDPADLVTGWVFAVGAKGAPPNQWFYDGPEPPMGYRGSDPAWGARPFERGPNWDK